MAINLLSSEKEFEDFCLDAFKSILHGEMFPYSLRGTYHLVFNSWDEAVNELQENGVEGYSYQEKPEDDDYFLSLHGFTQHVVMQDKTLELLACFCNKINNFVVKRLVFGIVSATGRTASAAAFTQEIFKNVFGMDFAASLFLDEIDDSFHLGRADESPVDSHRN